jgi:ParB/RepB/Spo0J family partition protein
MIIPIDKITPNPEQPRRDFDQDALDTLADSIRQHGLINPISVEQLADGSYQLIDGERRFRAAKLAGLTEIEASVRSGMNGSGNTDRLALALVANIQRQDMNPKEEGEAFTRLQEMGYTAQQIGDMVGLYVSNVRTRLHIVKLEPEIQDLFAQRKLPLHWNVIKAIRELPDELRIEQTQRLAARNATINTIISVCARISNRQKVFGVTRPGSPAIREVTSEPSHWNALAQVHQVPPWKQFSHAVQETCEGCDLHHVASDKTCRPCPVVDLLKNLTKHA